MTLNPLHLVSLSPQVSGLQEGETYVFRVRSVNANGVGKPSQLSEPVCAKALPGKQYQTTLTALYLICDAPFI